VTGREAELTAPSALFSGLGFQPGPVMPAVIAELTPGMAAEQAGLKVGDLVIEANDAKIAGWEELVDFVRKHPGETIDLTVERDGERLSVPVTVGQVDDNGQTVGRIGASRPVEFAPEVVEKLVAEQRYGVLESLPRSIEKTWEVSALTVRMLVRMVVGDVSVKNISGPITIATYAGDSAQAGLSAFLSFLAVVSISLGILNLLPIPLLDGGQIVYQVAEWLKGSPLSERALVLGHQVGVLFLIVLMSFVFYNDLSRIFS
jgi:regulator of sigma E protease